MRIDIKQQSSINQQLQDILIWLEHKTGLEFTITSLYRSGDSGVHGVYPTRGVDLRCRDLETGKAIEKLINLYWQYDPLRLSLKTALLHGKGSNLHLHLQVHRATEKVLGD